jgi:hypothetical protein
MTSCFIEAQPIQTFAISISKVLESFAKSAEIIESNKAAAELEPQQRTGPKV